MQTKKKIKVYHIGNYGISFQKWSQASDTQYRYYRKWKYFVTIHSLHTTHERYKTLLLIKNKFVKDELYKKGSYQHGLLNGIIYSTAILEGKRKEDYNLIEIKQDVKIVNKKKRSNLIILPEDLN